MGDLKRVETREASTVCKSTRSKMLDVREEETKFEERVIAEHVKATYHIITMNMNGKNYGKGTTNRRRERIVSFLKHSPISVIFCQELPDIFETEIVEKFGYGDYDYTFTGNESAVMWRLRDFNGNPVQGTDSSISKTVERLQRTRSDVDVSEVRTRTAMVELTSRKTGASFLAVSWHGPHSKKKETDKLMTFKGLTSFLHEVCEEEGLSSFIIGGDFNLNTSDIDKRTETDCEVVISRDYLLCNRDRERQLLTPRPGRPIVFYKDNFIVSSPSDKYPMTGNVRVFWVEALEFESYESSENEPLDHAPVVGVLELDKLLYTYKKPSIKQDRETITEDTSDKTTNEKDRPELTPETTARTAKVGSRVSDAQRELKLKDDRRSFDSLQHSLLKTGDILELIAVPGQYDSKDEEDIKIKLQEEFLWTEPRNPCRGQRKNGKPDLRFRENRETLGLQNKDGSPDMRFKINKEKFGPVKKDGTPDMRYAANKSRSSSSSRGPLKKDGTPDMRFKANRR